MQSYLKKSLLMLALSGIHFTSFAQCAMCRATVENNVSNGDTSLGAGLNFGILYLFVTPYLLAAVIGFFWYKNAKKRGKKLSIKSFQ
jgi:hypothetical protein